MKRENLNQFVNLREPKKGDNHESKEKNAATDEDEAQKRRKEEDVNMSTSEKKIDVMKWWPLIPFVLGAVWYAGHLDARMNNLDNQVQYMEDSINTKLDAIAQTLETRQSYDEREIAELKGR